MVIIKLKLKGSFQDKKPDMIVTLETDQNGNILDPYWARRMYEHMQPGADQWFDILPADNAVKIAKSEVVKEAKKD